MQNILVIIIMCFFCLVCAVFSLPKQFQMLQQNSYFPSRYIKWLKDSFFESLVFLTFCFCAICITFLINEYLSLAVIILFTIWQGYDAVKTYTTSIKKLVITARIIRLFIASTIPLLVLTVLILANELPLNVISLCALLFISVFSPVLTLISYYMTKPIENAFSKHYIKDAKKKLSSAKNLKVIGVTGSYGKTGTKFILARILSEKYNVLATPQSFNTPMGVVRTIREKLRAQTEIFVCEMGAKNIGDIKEICDIVNPDMAVITSVGAQHLETFKSVDNVFKTKFELYDACTKKDGKVFVNLASDGIRERIFEKKVVTYGDENADIYATDITYSKEGATFNIIGNKYSFPVSTKLLGKHSVQNILGAVGIAIDLGLTPEEIQYAVSRLEPTEHRLELKKYINGSLCLDDAYNANPEGCIEAVQVLSSFNNMKKVIVTPGLVELGEQEYNFNYKLGLAAAKISDIIILVGKKRAVPMNDAILTTDFNTENLYIVGSFKEAMEIYSSFADENTVVLLENDLPDNYLN